jgi:hypothetical protein
VTMIDEPVLASTGAGAGRLAVAVLDVSGGARSVMRARAVTTRRSSGSTGSAVTAARPPGRGGSTAERRRSPRAEERWPAADERG